MGRLGLQGERDGGSRSLGSRGMPGAQFGVLALGAGPPVRGAVQGSLVGVLERVGNTEREAQRERGSHPLRLGLSRLAWLWADRTTTACPGRVRSPPATSPA